LALGGTPARVLVAVAMALRLLRENGFRVRRLPTKRRLRGPLPSSGRRFVTSGRLRLGLRAKGLRHCVTNGLRTRPIPSGEVLLGLSPAGVLL
jgi:hypothetical protein